MLKILTIGNSFADNAVAYLSNLAHAGNEPLLYAKANLGGCSLEKHWNLVMQTEMLPEVKPYSFFRSDKEYTVPATLKDALCAEQWDVVTMQQVSDLSYRPDTYFPFLDRLAEYVQTYAPGARIVLHQTWAYRTGADEFARYSIDQETMYRGILTAYREAAGKLNVPLLPCGTAFQNARRAFCYQPDTSFDFVNARPYAVPEQSKSLMVGYYWQTGNTATGKATLVQDSRHGNAKGKYLAGAVWYLSLTGKGLQDNTFCPDGVSFDELSVLKECAASAVEEYGRVRDSYGS